MLSTRFFRFFRYLNWKTLTKTVARVGQRRLFGLSSEIAYNAMLSLFPAILAVITAIGLFEESFQSTFKELASQLSQVAPDEAMVLIRDFSKQITQTRNTGLFSISFIVAIWAASGALSAAMTALDRIHEIPPKQMRPFWKAKLVSLGLTIGTILLLVVASFLVFISDWLLDFFVLKSQNRLWFLLIIWQLLSWPIALAIVAAAFGFVYRYGPSIWNPGMPLMPGAVLAAVSWALVSAGFRLYVANFGNYNQAYGAIGAVIVLMLWLYMSGLVLLVGDQLNVTVGEQMRSRSQVAKRSASVQN
ncbi:YihY/virulence factor BrkB family protein [Scytonema millei]|uniref:YihY/virulence factor BrkB family protein n=1 Tax=Scytonema millei VB511283 TaxID=1245923 RepID=A0A9X5E637_9CYAN|nr:YihY/virulence factor BrkB family protein [Scytonema millei]NHC35493.1 YihY/virulence factor BrkB family protein [Scytonema millei VB511283]